MVLKVALEIAQKRVKLKVVWIGLILHRNDIHPMLPSSKVDQTFPPKRARKYMFNQLNFHPATVTMQ